MRDISSIKFDENSKTLIVNLVKSDEIALWKDIVPKGVKKPSNGGFWWTMHDKHAALLAYAD